MKRRQFSVQMDTDYGNEVMLGYRFDDEAFATQSIGYTDPPDIVVAKLRNFATIIESWAPKK